MPGILGQLSLPSLWDRYINRVLAYWLGLRQGAFTCVGWQVILCDPICHVTPRSSSLSALTFIYFEPVERFTNRRDVRAFRGDVRAFRDFYNRMSKRTLIKLKTI